jgi:hypothetical protein
VKVRQIVFVVTVLVRLRIEVSTYVASWIYVQLSLFSEFGRTMRRKEIRDCFFDVYSAESLMEPSLLCEIRSAIGC